MMEKLKETASFLKNRGIEEPEIGIILGTGLGSLANDVQVEISLDYKDIPHFPLSTVESHSGKLLYGKLGDKKVLVMN
ncbi:Purine nucleoside phosphorylase, partial [hydrothermal vent metagenome]